MIDRRNLLTGLGGMAAAGGLGLSALGLPALGLAAPSFNLGNRGDFLTACMKMRGSIDDRLCIGWVIGTRYAVVEHKAIPMMGLIAATFARGRKISDEAYEVRSIEVAYFTDLQDRKLIETWQNPVTGKTVEVPQTRMGPARLIVTADGLDIEVPAGEARGLELNHHFNPAIVRGDDVWVTEVIGVDGARPGQKRFVYNEMSTYHARLSDLADPGQATVATNVDFHGLVTFRPWMGFGDTPGHTTARGSGTRAARIEDLPPYYLELTEKYHPDVLDDPLAVLAGEPDEG